MPWPPGRGSTVAITDARGEASPVRRVDHRHAEFPSRASQSQASAVSVAVAAAAAAAASQASSMRMAPSISGSHHRNSSERRAWHGTAGALQRCTPKTPAASLDWGAPRSGREALCSFFPGFQSRTVAEVAGRGSEGRREASESGEAARLGCDGQQPVKKPCFPCGQEEKGAMTSATAFTQISGQQPSYWPCHSASAVAGSCAVLHLPPCFHVHVLSPSAQPSQIGRVLDVTKKVPSTTPSSLPCQPGSAAAVRVPCCIRVPDTV